MTAVSPAQAGPETGYDYAVNIYFHSLTRRVCLRAVSSLVGAGLLGHAAAQIAPAPTPVPPLWQSLGVSSWPARSPALGLEFNEIVLPGTVPLRLRSDLQFTQKLVLFAHPPGAPEAMAQLASFSLGPKVAPDVAFALQASASRHLILLAQTPAGWFMAERQLKVGRQP